MNKTLNIFQYQSYRRYIRDWLKLNDFTYRTFAERYKTFVSFIALAKLLAQGKEGKDRSHYKMSPEIIARLGKIMRLSDDELKHLILLRLENDSENLSGQYGTIYRQIMRRFINEHKNFVEQSKNYNSTSAPKEELQGSEISRLVFEIFELFPKSYQQHCLEEIIFQGRSYAARQAGKPGVKALHTVLTRLDKYREI